MSRGVVVFVGWSHRRYLIRGERCRLIHPMEWEMGSGKEAIE